MLLERIRSLLPDGDNMKYKTTESHFDWSKVCFGNFTGDMCRQKWQKVSSEVRKQQVWKMIRATCQNFYLTGFSFNINVFKLLKGTMSQKHKQLSSLLLISINSGYFVKCLKSCRNPLIGKIKGFQVFLSTNVLICFLTVTIPKYLSGVLTILI